MSNKSIDSKKDVIVSSKGNKEALYYICLFGAAFIASIALMIYALIRKNTGLEIYSYVLVPLFFLASIISVRFYLVSINSIYTNDGYLYIKKFFLTRKISTANIDNVTVATFGEDHRTSLKITYGEKTVKYQFKKIDKESATKLRKLKNS